VERGKDRVVDVAALRRVDYAELVRKGHLEDRPPVSLRATAGVRVRGEQVKDWGSSIGPLIELGFDLEAISLNVEGFFARHSGSNADLSFTRTEWAINGSIYAGLDLGAGFYLGLGVRGGATRHAFEFSTDGAARARVAWQPNGAVAGRLEWSPWSGLLCVIDAGGALGIFSLEDIEGTVVDEVVISPFIDLRLGWYLF
jgi:hypothetical protein